jgi:spore maturation protein CgeB
MKLLYLGDLATGQTCRMRMEALERLGHDVCGVDTVAPWRSARWIQRQLQRRRSRGSVVEWINSSAVAACREFRPQLVWADKQEFLRPETVAELQRLGAKTVHFTPDPYFTLAWKRTPLMDQAMQAFDVLVYCKSYERAAYESLGKPSYYMPLGSCDRTHRPVVSADPKWSCAVGFLGGWEPRREVYLHALAAREADLKIWGGYWEFLKDGRWTLRRAIILRQLAGGDRFKIHRDPALASRLQGGEVYGDDYAKALTNSRIGLGFLRKVCPDQHTTRTFEIPACGSMLLADRTAEHQAFFEEGKEAEFFESQEEMVDKVAFYTANEAARSTIAAAGYRRCIDSRYSYLHRMSAAIDHIATDIK